MARVMKKRYFKRLLAIAMAVIMLICVILMTACDNFGSDAPQGISEDVRNFIKIKDERMIAEAEDYKGYIFKNGDDVMTFRMKSPANFEEGKTYPLIIFLHGKGDGGTDNSRHMYKSLIESIDKFVNEDCYVLLPQAGSKSDWTEKGNNSGLIYNKMLNTVLASNAVDMQRIYLTGMSMGGYGTMYQAFNHAEIYAAAMPLCGYYEMEYFKDMSALKDMPIWLSHGLLDNVIPWTNTLNLYNALVVGGNSDVHVTYIEDGYHDITSAFYNDAAVWEWLMAKRK